MFTTPPSVLGKRRQEDLTLVTVMTERLPVRTLVYQVVRADDHSDPADLDTAGREFLTQSPAPLAGMRSREYAFRRSATVARCDEEPCDAALRDRGCDGWWNADGSIVTLLYPAALLELTDDDKLPGMAQTFLTDMFLRHSLRGTGS